MAGGRWQVAGGRQTMGGENGALAYQSAGAMHLDLIPNGIRDEDGGKIGEQIETSQLIQVNQGTGVTDDERTRGVFSRFHGGPTGHQP